MEPLHQQEPHPVMIQYLAPSHPQAVAVEVVFLPQLHRLLFLPAEMAVLAVVAL
jgi:hypothetical protein